MCVTLKSYLIFFKCKHHGMWRTIPHKIVVIKHHSSCPTWERETSCSHDVWSLASHDARLMSSSTGIYFLLLGDPGPVLIYQRHSLHSGRLSSWQGCFPPRTEQLHQCWCYPKETRRQVNAFLHTRIKRVHNASV